MRLFVQLNQDYSWAHGHLAQLCHGLGFKGFYPGREKSCLEGMT
jgi:hypothetical protein